MGDNFYSGQLCKAGAWAERMSFKIYEFGNLLPYCAVQQSSKMQKLICHFVF